MDKKQEITPIEYFCKTGIRLGPDEKREIIQSTEFLTEQGGYNNSFNVSSIESDFYQSVAIAMKYFKGTSWINYWTWYKDYFNLTPKPVYDVKIEGTGVYEIYSDCEDKIRDAGLWELNILDALGIARNYWHWGDAIGNRVRYFKTHENLKLV